MVTNDDMVLGREDAAATLIVYSSASCPHCHDFHNSVWVPLKSSYIDPGLLRFVFREAAAPIAEFSAAAFQLARCNGADAATYFERVSQIFSRGRDLMRYEPILIIDGKVSGGGMNLEPLIELGATFGLSADQVVSCIEDDAGTARAERLLRIEPWRYEITGLPTLILNDRMLDSRDREIATFAGLARAIDSQVR